MNVLINAFLPKYTTHRTAIQILGYTESCSSKYEYHGMLLFNEMLVLKEKRKVDLSLGRGYFIQSKHVRTQTLYINRND